MKKIFRTFRGWMWWSCNELKVAMKSFTWILTLLLGSHSILNAQPAPSKTVLGSDVIRGKLLRFDQSPHVAVPVQLPDRSNQVGQTQLSRATRAFRLFGDRSCFTKTRKPPRWRSSNKPATSTQPTGASANKSGPSNIPTNFIPPTRPITAGRKKNWRGKKAARCVEELKICGESWQSHLV